MGSFKPWQALKKNSIIDIIAPASGIADKSIIEKLKVLLESWQLTPRIAPDLFGPDLLCANSDEKRFQQLKDALLNSSSQAIWCLRGGYGCTRLIPSLLKLTPPEKCKLFIGFSDITALHLFLQQKWHWQTLHAPTLNQVAQHLIVEENINELKKVIFGQLDSQQLGFSQGDAKTKQPDCINIHEDCELSGNPDKNSSAKSIPELSYLLTPYHKPTILDSILAPLTGGSLSLVQTSLGTDWQIETKDKILFLEDVNEVAYRIDRMLQHLQQSGILIHVKAILFGDFTFTAKIEEEKKIQEVLARFAKEQYFPVLHCPGIGHGEKNRCLPLGTSALLDLNKNQLTIKITG